MNYYLYKVLEMIFVVSFGIVMILGLFTLGGAWGLGLFYIFSIIGDGSFNGPDMYMGMIVFYSLILSGITFPFVYLYEEQFNKFNNI